MLHLIFPGPEVSSLHEQAHLCEFGSCQGAN